MIEELKKYCGKCVWYDWSAHKCNKYNYKVVPPHSVCDDFTSKKTDTPAQKPPGFKVQKACFNCKHFKIGCELSGKTTRATNICEKHEEEK